MVEDLGGQKKSVPELLQEFLDGSDRAFTELIRRYRRKIYSLAYQMLGNHLDADEVVQESFVRVYKRREDLNHVTNFTSFLIRIATNYSIDLLRKRRIYGEVSNDPSSLPGEIQTDLSRHVRTPGDLFRDKALMEEIQRALDLLPPKQKITAILHDVEGYTKAEIASILECPEATVRSNLHIARTKLKKILKKRLTK
ncbi:MAG: RNA polymerase sigma factor [candidate division Zixibacteria bacterium]|jgi:RNA polymerase sigma-70 factor (ECF subfamily)|nr:RNA polymerase sigma factor [candidate division Zixibacteria bacterium]